MNSLAALILGLVEGLTEFLPVSSTGHLILTSNALGLPNSEFVKMFEIVIQAGAIAAVILIYLKDILADKSLFMKMSVAFFPTGVLGLLVHKIVKAYLFTPVVVCSALFIGGIVLLFLENLTKNVKPKEFTYKHYFLLGVIQCFAFIPGVSRSAATILGARMLGSSREDAVKFSFLLAIPTILAASAYSMLKMKYTLSSDEVSLLGIGLVTSFISGFIAVKTFLKFLNHKTFVICGVYRMVIAVVYFMVFINT